jgi:hypothetical protein
VGSKCGGKTAKNFDGRISGSALDTTQITQIDFRLHGQLLLRELPLSTQAANVRAGSRRASFAFT